MRRSIPALAATACLLAAACGPPDNEVHGGVASGNAAYPDAAIPKVRSAIHGLGTVTNQRDGTTVQRSIIILSSTDNLCASLQRSPSYFQSGSAPEQYAALVLMTPPGIDGDFFLAAQNSITGQADVSYLAAFKAGPLALFPGVDGDTSVVEFNTAGNARGSFNLYVSYATNAVTFVYGHYKTDSCAAIAQAYVPRFR